MSRKIAFVDSESNVLESLKWLFEEEPYHLYTFSNPLEALKKMEEEEFALVVADQHTREMEGVEFLQKVKERLPNTVCMIMTTLPDINMATDAMGRKYIYCIISKPWDNHELKDLVKEALNYYDKIRHAGKTHNNDSKT
jgi:DNA-binding NtrC family response regulator